jgi:hypothetical protein
MTQPFQLCHEPCMFTFAFPYLSNGVERSRAKKETAVERRNQLTNLPLQLKTLAFDNTERMLCCFQALFQFGNSDTTHPPLMGMVHER